MKTRSNTRYTASNTGLAKPTDTWEGVLLIDKPKEWTSHDVVARIRNHFHLKKVGHGGTLDPMATGLLVILLGRGTKLSSQIMGTDKIYHGTIHLGISTDSQDATGQITAHAPYEGITQSILESLMARWIGDRMQTPPMVSAIKKNGVPLYKLARKGKTVEREPRLIHIYNFKLMDFNPPQARFQLHCTKGTYVRTICSDLGDTLQCGAHLAELCRVQSGQFKLSEARSMEEITQLTLQELSEIVIPLHQAQKSLLLGS